VQASKTITKNIEKWLQAAWYKPTLLSTLSQCILWPLSQVYKCLAFVHKSLYRIGLLKTQKVSVPVIVVGNITAGGGGKTPTVIALVQHLQAQNINVGVISRGYGRASTECLEVKRDSKISDVGDEPASILLALDLMAVSAPVFVANRRYDAASALLKAYPDTQVIISDDGLQHHALHHDIAITVFDDRGLGNGLLLPAGPLREASVKCNNSANHSALDSANNSLVLHTGNQAVKLPNVIAPQFTAKRVLAQVALRSDGTKVDLNELKTASKPLLALAGIAHPEAFFTMLRNAGLTLAETISLPDHYAFNSSLGNKYEGYSPKSTVLCTMKDAVKLWQIDPQALAVPLAFAPEKAFFEAFDAMLKPILKR
jgi:tetraacyldisaccharide 4'-kinase